MYHVSSELNHELHLAPELQSKSSATVFEGESGRLGLHNGTTTNVMDGGRRVFSKRNHSPVAVLVETKIETEFVTSMLGPAREEPVVTLVKKSLLTCRGTW